MSDRKSKREDGELAAKCEWTGRGRPALGPSKTGAQIRPRVAGDARRSAAMLLAAVSPLIGQLDLLIETTTTTIIIITIKPQ